MHGALKAATAAMCAIAWSTGGAMAARTDCQPQALRDLERLSPEGHAIYGAMPDKRHFLQFLTCDDVVLGLSTAVHESVHLLTADKDAYPLIDGTAIRRPPEGLRFFPPRDIARRFDARDIYVQSYLKRGSASSSDDFRYLMDELNAYSHDLQAAVKLVSLRPIDRQVGHRDGLAALMTFVMAYTDAARRSSPATWEGLQRPEIKKVVQTLWVQAEGVLASSCSVPAFGQEDRKHIAYLCNGPNGEALGHLLGRAPVCPATCMGGATAATGGSVAR
jgi:hypothetical protein